MAQCICNQQVIDQLTEQVKRQHQTIVMLISCLGIAQLGDGTARMLLSKLEPEDGKVSE